MKTTITTLFIAFALLFNTNVLSAATNTDLIVGVIVDENNQPIESATAVLVRPDTKEVFKGKATNKKGEFSINDVKPGEYILSVSSSGKDKLQTERITVDGNGSTIEKKIVLKEQIEKCEKMN